MLRLVLLVLATFFVWETLRYIAERYISGIFTTTRPLHPFLVAGLPFYVLWPDWVAALGVAGAVGLLVGVADKWLSPVSTVPQYVPRTQRAGGLPPLP